MSIVPDEGKLKNILSGSERKLAIAVATACSGLGMWGKLMGRYIFCTLGSAVLSSFVTLKHTIIKRKRTEETLAFG